MDNGFFAMVSRMRYINRWALMRNTRTENIEEHSLQVAIIAHAIATIRKELFSLDMNGKSRISVDPNLVTTLAIYHDTNEILTGDMPTPVKYFNPAITEAFRDIEVEATKKLMMMLPNELASPYSSILSPDKTEPAIAQAMKIVKSADRISALIKCIEEEKAGNKEFVSAEKTIRKSIEQNDLPEVAYFMENFLPAFSKTLDELEKEGEGTVHLS
ncbi:MAG: 5'-deoxynucleotidase [Saccharofermentanales bacterium]